MSPEFGMASAMFSVLILPPVLFIAVLVGGMIAGFVLDRYFGNAPIVNSKKGFGILSLICAVAVGITLGALTSPPELGMTFPIATYVKMFAACALVAFWQNVRRNPVTPNSVRTDKRGFELKAPVRGKIWFDTGVIGSAAAPVKMKLEIRPDEDMTVVVVYSAKDGSFKNREIFSSLAKKGQGYKWEIEIPPVSGTATVYLVTGDTGSWAGEKDYEF